LNGRILATGVLSLWLEFKLVCNSSLLLWFGWSFELMGVFVLSNRVYQLFFLFYKS